MRGWIILSILIVTTINSSAESKILTRCDAARALARNRNISRTWITNWVCLMESESGMNTSLIIGPKADLSYSYGVFQINSRRWCTRGRVGGVCNKRCEDFADDDIDDDISCAKKMWDAEGFQYWAGWVRKCKGKPLPDLNHCW